MKRVVILATGFSLLLGSAAAFGVEATNNSPNQKISAPTDHSSPAPLGTLHQTLASKSQLTGNSVFAESPRDAGGVTRNLPVSEPVELSSGPAPTEAPMPPAGWIALAGVLGVMAARWFSAARRSRTKSAFG
jgi:hypothetical protein